MKLSNLSDRLIPSEIIKLGNAINEMKKEGKEIYNFTIGDFDPSIFPIPEDLKIEIKKAYDEDYTNYPPPNGILSLREAISTFIKNNEQLDYTPNEVLISGGGRPLIYAAYRAIIDPQDTVFYASPSWNNNHYVSFIDCKQINIETKPENNFMPTLAEIKPYIKEIQFLALCSPQNPTGTMFTKIQLQEISEAVYTENIEREKNNLKPIYILFDQIYWRLTYDGFEHFTPITLIPELKKYTILIDGISKAYAATGVRVGWALGPIEIIDKMKAILSHVGAWAPLAEQVAVARFLNKEDKVIDFENKLKEALYDRLKTFYNYLKNLENKGLPIKVINPTGGIYLTLQFDLIGKRDSNGHEIKTVEDISNLLLKEASLALVPFTAFGTNPESNWYRLSVGTCKKEDIEKIYKKIEAFLNNVK